MQYQKYIFSTRKSVKVLKSGFLICRDLPVLGTSPDGKVIDLGCRNQTVRVTPIEACFRAG